MLADLIDFISVVPEAGTGDSREQRERDRRIGVELSHLAARPVAQLRAWLGRVAPDRPLLGSQFVHARRLTTSVLIVLGGALGWVTAMAVFHYDGSRPINVVHALALFVGAQLLLLAATIVLALPGRRAFTGSVQAALSVLSPGRLGRWLMARLHPRMRERLAGMLGEQAGSPPAGLIGKWQVLLWSQVVAVAFNSAAVVTFLYLVVSTDLAFAWSTTLGLDAESFGSLAHALAAPWRSWLPDAVPSAELVAATRFYRLDEGLLPDHGATLGSHPATLGDWWPFLAASMLCYGLAPRLALLIVAGWRLRAALSRAFLATPGAAALLERMNTPFVATQATQGEPAPTMDQTPSAIAGGRPSAGDRAFVIEWAGIGLSQERVAESLRAMGVSLAGYAHAGGSRAPREDEHMLQRLGGELDGAVAVLLVVKAWEPPMLEIVDFVRAVRAARGRHGAIVVVPVELANDNAPADAAPPSLSVWRAALHAAGDASVSVATWSELKRR